jgi:hypothetical protein
MEMKKLFVAFLAVAMTFTFAGTAMAVLDGTVNFGNVQNDAGNTMRVFYPGTYVTVTTGASAYFVTNQGFLPGTWTLGGTTVWGVSNNDTNAAGTEMLAAMMTDVAGNNLTGCTPIGGPQVISSTTSHVIQLVLSNQGVNNNGTNGGASIYRIEGGPNSRVVQEIGIPYSGITYTPNFSDEINVRVATIAGTTPWMMAVPTIEWEEAHSAASVYGISGVSHTVSNVGGGVSIWRRNTDWLGVAPADTGANAGTTAFPVVSGVSAVWASPVIAGNSVFVVAYFTNPGGAANAGISIFQLDKRDFSAAAVGADASACGIGLNSANVIEPGGDASGALAAGTAQITPTPAVQVDATGGTIYVVDWTGGVSLYDAQDLSMNRGDYQQYFLVKDNQGVTASPVCTDSKLVIAWSSSVSCFETMRSTGSGVSQIWEYDFDEGNTTFNNRYQVWATPVISNGYVWVTAEDTTTTNSVIYRFRINDDYDGDPVIVTTEPQTYGGPIVVRDNRDDDDDENGNLWYCSYNPTVDRWEQDRWAAAYNYWTQFKFGADKAGENTWIEDEDVPPGDSSGCFISTLK